MKGSADPKVRAHFRVCSNFRRPTTEFPRIEGRQPVTELSPELPLESSRSGRHERLDIVRHNRHRTEVL